MKVGQACTFVDDTGREYSATITRVIENPDGPDTETKANVVFTRNSQKVSAELVPESRIKNVHDTEQAEESSVVDNEGDNTDSEE